MKRSTLGILIGIAAISLLTNCDNEPQQVDRVSKAIVTDHDGAAPRAYRGDNEVKVRFSSNVNADCYAAGLRGGDGRTNACAVIQGDDVTLIVPNPCRVSGSYAGILCHEIGHANGWKPDHSG